MSNKVQLVGGAFQDAEGNLLANGYLEFVLNQDSTVVGSGNIAAGRTIRVQLDSDANAASSTSTPPASNQSIWGTDVLLPANAYYRVTGYTAQGQPAWGPNNQQVVGSGTFDLGNWIPNQVFSWTPPTTSVLLETNGSPNTIQSILDLEEGNNITLTDNGDGSVTIDAAQGGWTLDVNGVQKAPTPHSTINLTNGNGVTLTDNGSGFIRFDGLSFTSSGQGFLWSSQSWGPTVDQVTVLSGSPNRVHACQLILFAAYSIKGITIELGANTGSPSWASCAIYSYDGLTKIMDAGVNAFDTSTGGAFIQTKVITPVTIQPGVYWFAWGDTLASPAVTLGVVNTTNNRDITNATQSRIGTAANPMTGGGMPATLGAVAYSDVFSIPSFFLEV